MDVQVLASGSGGNCYRISAGGSSLLLECGLPLRQIREGLDFGLSRVAGCLLTHEHGDHARAAADLMRAGVDVYTSRGTAAALDLAGHRLQVIRAKQRFTVGPWNVIPFDMVHDAAEPLGFLIDSENERLLFATDTAYLRYRFSGITQLMIECNYDLTTLKANVAAGLVDRQVKRRVLHSHMHLETVRGLLEANDLSRVKEIWLLHLSDDNSDEERFKAEVRRLSGKPVYVAAQRQGGRST